METQEDAAFLRVCSESCSTGGGSTSGRYATLSALISVLPGKITNHCASVLHQHLSNQVKFISESDKQRCVGRYRPKLRGGKELMNKRQAISLVCIKYWFFGQKVFTLLILCKLNSKYLQKTVDLLPDQSRCFIYKEL